MHNLTKLHLLGSFTINMFPKDFLSDEFSFSENKIF